MNSATIILFTLLAFIYGSGIGLFAWDGIKSGKEGIKEDLKYLNL